MYLHAHIPDLHLLTTTIPEHSLSLPDQPAPPLPYPYGTRLPRKRKPYHVFIAHRGIDTKEKEAGLVYDYLRGSGYLPFLDVESLEPGEKLPDAIDEALHECKLGIVIFSPRFSESRPCLEELVRLVRMGKPLLPIFSNVEPSELRVAEYRVQRDTAEEVKQFTEALEEAKQVLGLRFKSVSGNWSKLGRDTVKAVDGIFLELGEERRHPRHEVDPPKRITTLDMVKGGQF